jgi:hypothetical protein
VDVAIGRAAQRTRDGGGAALKERLKGTAGIISLGEVDAPCPWPTARIHSDGSLGGSMA